MIMMFIQCEKLIGAVDRGVFCSSAIPDDADRYIVTRKNGYHSVFKWYREINNWRLLYYDAELVGGPIGETFLLRLKDDVYLERCSIADAETEWSMNLQFDV